MKNDTRDSNQGVEQINFEQGHRLGGEEPSMLCTDIYELKTHCLSMATQAQRSLALFTQELEPELFDNQAFAKAVQRLAKAHRHSKIRILTHSCRQAEKNGHALGSVTERLPSFVSIRETPRNEKNLTESYLIADVYGLILREVASKRAFKAHIDYNAPRLAKNKLQQFNEIWERSSPARAFRALHI